MEINKTVADDTLTVTLTGRLDTVTSPELERELQLDGVNSLVFDITGLDYVSSAGLRVFLAANKQMMKKGGMVIKGAQPVVREVFEITGFSDIFELK